MMNTENDYFRDYCKGENSEDEESNFDLQSRLYAEIYYTPYQLDELGTNPSLTTERSRNKVEWALKNNVHEKQLISTNGSTNLDHCRNVNQCKNGTDNTTERFQVESNSEVFTINGQRHTNHMDKELYEKTLCLDNNEIKIDSNFKSNLNNHLSVNTESNPQTVEITDTCHDQNLSSEKTADTNCVLPSSSKESNCQTDITQPAKSISNEVVVQQIYDNDILKKYQFSKGFINNLFIEKYRKLISKLRDEQMEGADKNTPSAQPDATEMDTRYAVQEKSEKERQNRNFQCEKSEDMPESESDSEESILEVPVPPKPQPPLINLQDSDDDFESISSSCSTICLESMNILRVQGETTASFNTQNISNPAASTTNIKHAHSKKRLNKEVTKQNPSTSTTQYIADSEVQEDECVNDIVLNCTDLQKGASSIREIREMSKEVQSEQNCSQVQGTENYVNKTIPSGTNDVCKQHVKNLEKHLQNDALNNQTYIEKDNENFYLCTVPSTSYVVEEDAQVAESNTDIDFTKDISLSSVSFDNETSSDSRKRRYDYQSEKNVSSKHTKSNNQANIVQHCSRTQTNQRNRVNTYANDNMPNQLHTVDNIYARDFDIDELQSKMSRDPRLWAILDEDLMPSPPKRQRFWNVKCSHCQREGHQRYNCPEPRRLPRCHMCGIQGHTETRCPRKMCLTCGKKQGTFRKTCETCRSLYCTMCNAIGHKATECPDLWRRFHQTTQNSNVNVPENMANVMKPTNLLFCCNCTKRGHDSSTCTEYRWSPHFPTPAHVSNYTDGPRYVDNSVPNPTKQTVAALTKNKKRKGTETYIPTVDLTELSHDICSYGTFESTQNDEKEIKRDILSLQGVRLVGLLAGRAAPNFLNELLKMFSFGVKIYRENNVKLVLLIRTKKIFIKSLLKLITHWLQVDEDEKEQCICVDLPRNKTEVLNLIKSKLFRYENSFQDPRTLYTNIKRLKKQINNLKGNSKNVATKRLSDFQVRLILLSHSNPVVTRALKRLEQWIFDLAKSKDNTLAINEYLQLLVSYNTLLIPHTPPFLKSYFAQYYRFMHEHEEGSGENGKSKKDKVQRTTYEKFLAKLRESNIKQFKKLTNKKSAQATSTSSCTSNANAHSAIAETSTRVTIQNFDKCKKANIIETVTLLHQNEIPHPVPAPVSSCAKAAPVDTTLTTPQVKSSTESNARGVSNVQPKHFKDVKAEKLQNKQEEQNVEEISMENSNETANDACTTKKKKKRSKKEKKVENSVTTEPVSQLNKNDEQNRDKSLIKKAKKIINEALTFESPYMNKAVLEVQKRLDDNSLAQKHLDVLQKLIDLEKSHQKDVTAFYNSLK